MPHGYVEFNGTILPFLRDAVLLGPANTSRIIMVGFTFSPDLQGSYLSSMVNNLMTWESTVGLTPGFEFCPVEQKFNSSSSSVLTINLPCHLDRLKTVASIGNIEQAFNLSINEYSYEGHTFYANSNGPVLPALLANQIIDMEGLNNFGDGIVVG